jgi:prevent-host-death family protein
MGSRAQSRAVQRPTGRAVRVKAPLSARSVRSVSITEARQKLCPLLRQVDALPGRKVGITVSGDVAAYLVSAKKLDELEAKARQSASSARPSIRGTIEIVGELDAASGSATAELERMALDAWDAR